MQAGTKHFFRLPMVYDGNQWVPDWKHVEEQIREVEHQHRMITDSYYRDYINGVGVKGAPKFSSPEASTAYEEWAKENYKPR